MKLIALLITALSLSAMTTYGQQADSTKQWTKKYILQSLGIKSQQEATNFDRWDPYISVAIISMDDEQRHGRFVAAGYSSSDAIFTQRFQRRGTDTTCFTCFIDTIGRVNSNLRSIDFSLGKIKPIKTWGDHHRLSWIHTIGYSFHRADIDYLDGASGRLDAISTSHGLLATVDLQYRYIISDKLTLALTGGFLRVLMAAERDKSEVNGESITTTLFNFDMSFNQVVSLGASIRLK
jgi:hypothetical protein